VETRLHRSIAQTRPLLWSGWSAEIGGMYTLLMLYCLVFYRSGLVRLQQPHSTTHPLSAPVPQSRVIEWATHRTCW
jgi:hypothetical protein